MRLWSHIQKFAKKNSYISSFFKIFLNTHIKKTSFGQMIACYKQNIHLLPFADVFLRSLFVFAGGGDSSIGHYGVGGGGGASGGGGGGKIAQLIPFESFIASE